VRNAYETLQVNRRKYFVTGSHGGRVGRREEGVKGVTRGRE